MYDSVDGELADRLWLMVSAGFNSLNQRSVLKQDMSFDEFNADMQDESVIKFVLTEHGGKLEGPTALGLIHTNPATVSWLNPYAMGETFQEAIENDSFHYVSSIVTHPDERNLRKSSFHTQQLVRYVAERAEQRSSPTLIGLDYCEQNDPALPRYIQWCLDKAAMPLEVATVSQQNWYEIELGQADTSNATLIETDLGDVVVNSNHAGASYLGEHYLEPSSPSPTDRALSGPNGEHLTLRGNLPSLGLFSESFDHYDDQAAFYLNGLDQLGRLGSDTDFSDLSARLADTMPPHAKTLIVDANAAHQAVLVNLVNQMSRKIPISSIRKIDHQVYGVVREAA